MHVLCFFPWENKEPHGLESKGTLGNLAENLRIHGFHTERPQLPRQAHGCSMLSLNDINVAGRGGSYGNICRAKILQNF